MLSRSLTTSLALSIGLSIVGVAHATPNVVVIIIDDLNDWIGCMGTHPQVRTPNIDRLAKQGMLFTNAHVQATFCGPSRISFLSGRMPQTTGCRSFDRYEALQSLANHPPFPLHFHRNGFQTFGGGKIFHHGTGAGWVKDSWSTILPSGPNPTPKRTDELAEASLGLGAFPSNRPSHGRL